jgi:hypothetical protein|tara:strand:- start:206 stop:406 length:201 start_codon:yes stop_codon:yes gene_type:complete
MSSRYVVINLDDEKEYIITNTIRSLSEYLNDMYLINKSHMYYHRVFKDKDNDKLIMERLIIYKLLL